MLLEGNTQLCLGALSTSVLLSAVRTITSRIKIGTETIKGGTIKIKGGIQNIKGGIKNKQKTSRVMTFLYQRTRTTHKKRFRGHGKVGQPYSMLAPGDKYDALIISC